VLASDTYLVVQRTDGAVEIYLRRGRRDPPLARIETTEPIRALKTHRDQLLVLEPGQIQVFSSRGELVRTLELPAAASYGDDRCYQPRCTSAELRLAGFEWPEAVDVLRDTIHRRKITTGKTSSSAGQPPPFTRRWKATGLTYSTGNRITYVGRREIDKLFG
jgi:hypothetical protein